MSRFNKKAKSKATTSVVDKQTRLAGGHGAPAAIQDSEALLRRAVLTCVLWDLAYESAEDNTNNIKDLIPKVAPQKVFDIAVEAREKQGLRHVPLLIAREMARLNTHKHLVGKLLPRIITRADMILDFLALYWADNYSPKEVLWDKDVLWRKDVINRKTQQVIHKKGDIRYKKGEVRYKKGQSIRKTISKQVAIGLKACLKNPKFNEYSFGKYDSSRGAIKFRDVMHLVRPKAEQGRQELHNKILSRTLAIPDTWETQLSAGKDKKETFTRLIEENKLGAMAFLRNLRNMVQSGVDYSVIRKGFETIKSSMLLPIDFVRAYKVCPQFSREIEDMMYRCYKDIAKLKGHSIFIVDVSGSMSYAKISDKSDMRRLDVAATMAMFAVERCEKVDIYVTAGNDGNRKHKTRKIVLDTKVEDGIQAISMRGFCLLETIVSSIDMMGGGGIFTKQCLDYIRKKEQSTPDRIMVFCDSQDVDYRYDKNILPEPFGKNNYIVDVESHKNGINYEGVWTAEINGWSPKFIDYIAAYEGLTLQEIG
ncbi:TROVE domain-containing protein [Calothrix sp. FACHB-1219]|uniref:TROVE domain-containing protein n=1 Tax=unclassified Calothrix TaxID=2619626 RepID=UPI001688FD10|nr:MULTISPECIES: TROVE domain-containing protein [unclassified Calothrix]MBD2201717.1 TROVE domain-containing protein [Calothrix sp. FACHB-168]MBD2217403.1 TROVE domain-containing protein [Calothrix sp. FACHB-1219]